MKKAVKSRLVEDAIVLIKGNEQELLFKEINKESLFIKNLEFLKRFGINNIYIITKRTDKLEEFIENNTDDIYIEIIEDNDLGTAASLNLIKDKVGENFIVLNGDTFNDFNLSNMVEKHIKSERLLTMGLITKKDPEKRGSVILDGDLIVDFREKQETSQSNIVNAGIYIVNNKVFELFNENTKSLEKDIFNLLAKTKQLQGFFTYGNFIHMPEFVEMPLSELIDRYTIARLKMERIGQQETIDEFEFLDKAIEAYKKRGVVIKQEWINGLYEANARTWDLEADLRKGKELNLGLDEVGRRAIAIRESNKVRIGIKNEIVDETGIGFKDIKKDHGSE